MMMKRMMVINMMMMIVKTRMKIDGHIKMDVMMICEGEYEVDDDDDEILEDDHE